MKKLIVLPGNSIENKTLAESVQHSFDDIVDDSKVLFYLHWESGLQNIDFEMESKRLFSLVSGWVVDTDSLYIIGKSAGALLTMLAIREQVIKPREVYFCGVPIGYGKTLGLDVDTLVVEFKNYCKISGCKVFIFQNVNDPVGSFDYIQQYLGHDNFYFKFVKLPGDNHGYTELDEYIPIIRKNMSN